jgi:hypothetical protein
MANINKRNLGAVGEFQVLSRLLLLGYQAAITNMTVYNMENIDIFCRNSKNCFAAIQVKTTKTNSINVGITHSKFLDNNGNTDLAAGLSYLESKIVGPWVMVQVRGSEDNPIFKFFIMSRKQVINMICDSERWYLSDFNRKKPLNGSGGIYLSIPWLYGNGVQANSNHKEWMNPFAGNSFENQWQNLWID